MRVIIPAGIFAVCILFISCNTHSKRILVFGSSDIVVDATQKNVKVGSGTTHHEKDLTFSGADPVVINAESPAGKFTLNATEDGLYILNLQKDTVVGSYQRIGTDNGKTIYSAAQVTAMADSLQQLTQGKNVTAAAKNYFIPPGTMSHIGTNVKAKVFGPYTTVPSGFDATSVPELYKFYTVNEVREIISKLSGMVK